VARKIFDGAKEQPSAVDQLESQPEPQAAFSTSDRPMLGQISKKPGFSSLGGIGRSLDDINRKALRADEIEKRLAEGQSVVELDATLIDPSFVRDRMQEAAGQIDSLLASIKESGQQVPVLVRPHPEIEGRYQIAFGHRRVAAAIALGIKVRAVVRSLTDDQLVIAQGQENNERANLSFIERARFAAMLEERGFSRDTMATALSSDKAELSRYVTIVTGIPRDILNGIGPAPKSGRPRWLEFVELLKSKEYEKKARSILEDQDVATLGSDDRFERVLGALKERQVTQVIQRQCVASDGTRLAKASRSSRRVSISLAQKAPEEFGDFILDRLSALYDEFLACSGNHNN
jgi:ParB family chromosome partitioning protein